MPVEQTDTFFSQQGAGVDIVLPVHANMDGVIKIRCDGFATARVTGQKHIPAHIPLFAMNMKLHSDILHMTNLLIF